MGQLPTFEELMEFADKDPEAFEIFRQQTCLQFIEATPNTHRHRLMAVQNRVEMALNRAKTPMARLLSVSSMMHESFYQLTSKLEEVDLLLQGKGHLIPITTPTSANIINLDDWKAQTESHSKPRH